MPRRGRRSGVRFIENDRDRGLTFFKRRSGLFKAASDLSSLTGARVAVVLESENERFSAFGTPDARPIVDAFLSGDVPTEFASEEQKAKNINLQNELFQLEKYKAMAENKKKESMARIKEIMDTGSSTAKYAFGKEEDLDATELYDMCRKLEQVKQEIMDRFPPILHGNHVEASGQLRDPSLLQPAWWRSIPSQVATPPKHSSLAPSQASSHQQHPWSSTSHPVLPRSGSSLMLPSQQMQPRLQQHPLASHAPSIMRLQAPQPKEAHPYNYHIHTLDTNGNNSHPLSFSPVLPSPPPEPTPLQTPPTNGSSPLSLSPQFSSPLYLESQQLCFNPHNYNFMQPPQTYANADLALIHSHEPFYGNSLELNFGLENYGANGGSGDHDKGFGLSTGLQGDGWAGVMHDTYFAGEISDGGNARSNLGDLNFPWF